MGLLLKTAWMGFMVSSLVRCTALEAFAYCKFGNLAAPNANPFLYPTEVD